jgi:hypothetical protein
MPDPGNRGPITTRRNTARTGDQGPGRSPLSSRRADSSFGGHLSLHAMGKGSRTPDVLRRKPPPPVGNGF